VARAARGAIALMLAPFQIHQPTTAEDACALRARHGEAAALYAGGSELLLAMKEGLLAFEHLIDVKTIPALHGIGVGAGGALVVGGAVTHRDLERSALVRARFPLLAEMEAQVANPRVRAVGTLGGNLCFAEPHSDPPTCLLVHGATVTLAGPRGPRRLPVHDFVTGPYESALAVDEMLTHVEIPPLPANASATYLKFATHERPTVGVAAALVRGENGTVAEARVSVGCVGPVATRLPALEAELAGISLAALARGFAPAAAAGAGLDAVDDLHGSADYKRHLAGVVVKRALALAARRATAAA
jgi:carbon-monoxide dehydrogenase medium subunit